MEKDETHSTPATCIKSKQQHKEKLPNFIEVIANLVLIFRFESMSKISKKPNTHKL